MVVQYTAIGLRLRLHVSIFNVSHASMRGCSVALTKSKFIGLLFGVVAFLSACFLLIQPSLWSPRVPVLMRNRLDAPCNALSAMGNSLTLALSTGVIVALDDHLTAKRIATLDVRDIKGIYDVDSHTVVVSSRGISSVPDATSQIQRIVADNDYILGSVLCNSDLLLFTYNRRLLRYDIQKRESTEISRYNSLPVTSSIDCSARLVAIGLEDGSVVTYNACTLKDETHHQLGMRPDLIMINGDIIFIANNSTSSLYEYSLTSKSTSYLGKLDQSSACIMSSGRQLYIGGGVVRNPLQPVGSVCAYDKQSHAIKRFHYPSFVTKITRIDEARAVLCDSEGGVATVPLPFDAE